MKEQLLISLTCELLRSQLPKVEEALYQSYTDGGRAAGARTERITAAIQEAHELAKAAVDRLFPK